MTPNNSSSPDTPLAFRQKMVSGTGRNSTETGSATLLEAVVYWRLELPV